MASPITRGRTLDHVAGVYDALSPLMLFGQETRMSRVCLDQLQDENIHSVLDIGCGTGTLTIEIAKLVADRSGKVVGIDAAPKMIDVAKRKGQGTGGLSFEVSAAESLSFSNDTFDYAVSTFFFHHIDLELKVLALNEAFRVLKPSGLFVIIDVDVPTTFWGSLCAWAGYYLFQQEEIRENIDGKLRFAIEQSSFGSFEQTAHHQGYISVFKMVKEAV